MSNDEPSAGSIFFVLFLIGAAGLGGCIGGGSIGEDLIWKQAAQRGLAERVVDQKTGVVRWVWTAGSEPEGDESDEQKEN